MFFLIPLIFIGALGAMLFLSPKVKLDNAVASKLSDFQFPRASESDPVPRIYGTVKTTGVNTIWAGDFRTDKITKKVKTGLFSSKKQTIGYKYYIGLDLAVCLGPNVSFRRIWSDKHEIWNGCFQTCENTAVVNLPNVFGGQDKNGGFGGTIAFYCGSFDQSQDSYLQAKVDPNVPAYVGVAHMVFRQCYVGNSTNIGAISVEVSCFPQYEAFGSIVRMPNCKDANPVAVLYDLYVNGWGNLAVDPALINTAQWVAVAQTVWNEGNGMSLIVANATSGKDLSGEILDQINGVLIENPSTGLIDLRLIRQDYIIANLPVLGPDQIVEIKNFTKKLWSQTNNRVRIKYTDRSNKFQDAIATADDFANIRYQGKVSAVDIQMPGVFEGDLATSLAARELSNLNVPLYTATITVNREIVALLPAMAFVLNWPEYGIEQMVVRIKKMSLGTLKDGKISCDIVQDEFALDAVVIQKPTRGEYNSADNSPSRVTDKKFFELPYFLDYNAQLGTRDGYSRFGVFAFAPGAYSLGFDAFVDDTPDDGEVIDNASYSASATLVEPFAQFDGFVTGILPSIKIQGVTKTSVLANGNADSVRLGRGLFMLGDEILGYETFALNGDGSYTLTNVHRALLDTGWNAAAVNARLYFFDGAEGFFETDSLIGQPQTAYLLDRTGAGRSEEATADHVGITAIGRTSLPLPPDNLTVNAAREALPSVAAGATATVAWCERNRLDATRLDFETDATATPEAGTTYKLVVTLKGVVLQTHDDIAATSYDIVTDNSYIGKCVVSVFAKRNGSLSFAAGQTPLIVSPADDALTVDYDVMTIDGSGVTYGG